MTEYKQGRYEEYEEIDYKKFIPLAEKYPKMFSKYVKTEYGVPYDILNRTETGGTYAIELKSRADRYGDCFIEIEKFSRLRDLWRANRVLPVYICFYPNETYMWVLSEIKNVRTYLDVTVKDAAGDRHPADRFGLDFADAVKFDRDYNIVSRPDYKGPSPEYKDPEIVENEITKYNWKDI